MKKILLLLLSASAVSAIAEDNGFYVGANLGYANVAGDGSSGEIIPNGSGNTWGIGINAGYSFDKNLAVEADYLMVPSYSISKSHTGAVFNGNELTTRDVNVTRNFSDSFLLAVVKGTLPLENNIDLFGKVGAGFNFSKSEDEVGNLGGWSITSNSHSGTNFAGMVGVGASYNISKQVALKLEDDYMITSQQELKADSNTIALGNVNFLSLGVEYKF